jgi:hypothetical protein
MPRGRLDPKHANLGHSANGDGSADLLSSRPDCVFEWWAVLGSNQWPLPCETEVGCLRINDMRATFAMATSTCCHSTPPYITRRHDRTVPKLSQPLRAGRRLVSRVGSPPRVPSEVVGGLNSDWRIDRIWGRRAPLGIPTGFCVLIFLLACSPLRAGFRNRYHDVGEDADK